MPRERGDHWEADSSNANQAALSLSQRVVFFFAKYALRRRGWPANGDFRRAEASLPQWRAITNGRRGPNFEICLECAAIFRHLPLTVRWGLGSNVRR